MASNVNIGQLKTSAAEFEKMAAVLATNEQKMKELISDLVATWQGEASKKYVTQFEHHLPELEQMRKFMLNVSTSLNTSAINYGKNEDAVSNVINSTLSKG